MRGAYARMHAEYALQLCIVHVARWRANLRFINWSRVDLSPEKQLANQNAETGEQVTREDSLKCELKMLVLSGDMVYEYGIGTYCKFLQIG